MNGGATLDSFRRVGTDGAGNVFAEDFRDSSLRILLVVRAGDAVAPPEAYGAAGGQTEVFFRRVQHEVVPFNPDFPCDGEAADALFRFFRIVQHFSHFFRVFRQGGDSDLEGIEHGHAARRVGIQVFPYAVFQQGRICEAVEFSNAYGVAEVADGGRSVAPAAHAGDGGHPWIVPAGDVSFLHQLQQLALAHDGVGKVQAGEFRLARACRDGAVFNDPVIEGAVVFKFQRAEGMGDVFVGIFQRVGEVIHGVNAPGTARVVVFREHDAVQHGVPHVHVAGGHVYPGSQDGFAFRDFSVFHGLEACQVFFHGAVAVG